MVLFCRPLVSVFPAVGHGGFPFSSLNLEFLFINGAAAKIRTQILRCRLLTGSLLDRMFAPPSEVVVDVIVETERTGERGRTCKLLELVWR